jgi:SAM-dependent methyltransferase
MGGNADLASPAAPKGSDLLERLAVYFRDHVLCNPMSPEKAETIIGLLDLPSGGTVLDVGCGKGEFLLRVAERWGVRGLGIDVSPYWVADARRASDARGLSSSVEIRCANAADYDGSEGPFDAVVCLGASFIWGGYAETLDALAAWARPGGLILVGEPFWTDRPSPEHLAAAGLYASSYRTHWGNVEAGIERGLRFLQAFVSSGDEWDWYEGLAWHRAERNAEAAGEPPTKGDHHFRDVYLKWGRREVGWAAYVFLKPALR